MATISGDLNSRITGSASFKQQLGLPVATGPRQTGLTWCTRSAQVKMRSCVCVDSAWHCLRRMGIGSQMYISSTLRASSALARARTDKPGGTETIAGTLKTSTVTTDDLLI